MSLLWPWGARLGVVGQGTFGMEQSSPLGVHLAEMGLDAQDLPHPWSCSLTVQLQLSVGLGSLSPAGHS